MKIRYKNIIITVAMIGLFANATLTSFAWKHVSIINKNNNSQSQSQNIINSGGSNSNSTSSNSNSNNNSGNSANNITVNPSINASNSVTLTSWTPQQVQVQPAPLVNSLPSTGNPLTETIILMSMIPGGLLIKKFKKIV